jgi:hypothetical protein
MADFEHRLIRFGFTPSFCDMCDATFPSSPDEPPHTWCPACEDAAAARNAALRATGTWIAVCPECQEPEALHRVQSATIDAGFGLTGVDGVVSSTPFCGGHEPEPYSEVVGCLDCYWFGREDAVGWRRLT